MTQTVPVYFVCSGYCKSANPELPKWDSVYYLSGVLRLPYAEIEEPFVAMFDGQKNRSRIDYYNNMVITVQNAGISQYGFGYMIAPMTTYTVLNQKTCFGMNGSSDAPVTIQSVLPSLDGFTYVSYETVNGEKCNKWIYQSGQMTKRSTYTLWTSVKSSAPVRYEMMGYDSLLGSHYDKYVLDYTSYKANVSFDDAAFAVPKNMTCGGFPGPGMKVHKVLMNPMSEYIHGYDEHITEMFQQFKSKHNRNYATIKEHSQRRHTFRQNVRFIHSKNRAGLSYKLDVNHLADRSDEEMRLMRGRKRTSGYNGGAPFDKSKYSVKDTPAEIDWRLYGAVTPVKDQGVCGSCWSFGTTGTIEGTFFLKNDYLIRLSQQELMDCSWGEGNNACDGGEEFRAYQWIMKNGGLTTEDQYGQYLAQDGYCKEDQVEPIVKLQGYVNVTSGDLQALTFALAHQGPVSVGIDASHKSLSFYSHGVYYEEQCGNTPDDLDHAVLAVGYGKMGDQSYWLIKNSWSTYWGNDGYVLMSQKNNNCGVTTDATYVLLG